MEAPPWLKSSLAARLASGGVHPERVKAIAAVGQPQSTARVERWERKNVALRITTSEPVLALSASLTSLAVRAALALGVVESVERKGPEAPAAGHAPALDNASPQPESRRTRCTSGKTEEGV